MSTNDVRKSVRHDQLTAFCAKHEKPPDFSPLANNWSRAGRVRCWLTNSKRKRSFNWSTRITRHARLGKICAAGRDRPAHENIPCGSLWAWCRTKGEGATRGYCRANNAAAPRKTQASRHFPRPTPGDKQTNAEPRNCGRSTHFRIGGYGSSHIGTE